MSLRLDLFIRFCAARTSLFNCIKEDNSDVADEIFDVSSHLILDMFEFLYMLSATNIDSGEKISILAMAHNAECERLLTCDPKFLAQMELNKTKIRDSMFSEKNIKKLRSNFELAKAIDQSDVARLLFKHMSRETARKVVILFDRVGLLTRIDTGDSVLVKPNGEAERRFEEYLKSLMLSSV